MVVDEDNPPYFDTIRIEQAHTILKMDYNFVLNFNIGLLDVDT